MSMDTLCRIMSVRWSVGWLVGWSHCEDDLSKHENTHENAVILYDNSTHDDPANHDDSAKHDSHDYHPKASEFT